MPSKSPRQRRFLYATKGAKWVKAHHFDQLAPKKKVTKTSKTKAKARVRRRKRG